jgi:hypothetical protein
MQDTVSTCAKHIVCAINSYKALAEAQPAHSPQETLRALRACFREGFAIRIADLWGTPKARTRIAPCIAGFWWLLSFVILFGA